MTSNGVTQETNLYTITVPPFTKALRALSKILDKAEAHAAGKASERHPAEKHQSALLNDRLVFDQFNFTRQVQVACDNAKLGVARIGALEAPAFPDTEQTFEELKTRVEKTIAFLESVKPEALIGKESATVKLPYYKDKHFTAFDYATEYLIPNFYFHVTTAYSILRKAGVTLGKRDYMGNLTLEDDAAK